MPALTDVKKSLQGLMHWVSGGDAAVEQATVNRRVCVQFPSGIPVTSGTVPEFPIYQDGRLPGGAVVTAVKYVPSAGLTANSTNYATLTLGSRTSAGGSLTAVATANTKLSGAGGTGDWSAFSPVSIAVTAANATVPANGMLTVTAVKSGTGVDIPSGALVIEYQEL